MKKIYLLATAITIMTCFSSMYAQTTIGLEDFDGTTVNLTSTTNVSDFGAGGGIGGDVFGRVDGQTGGTGMPFDVADDTVFDVSGAGTGANFPTDELGIAGQNTTAFFALNDMDAIGVNNAVWTFSGWGSATLSVVTIDIAGMGDFEAASSDGFLIEASIDGGAFQEIFRATTDESALKTYRPLDGGFVFSDDDPLELFIDGSATSIGLLDKCDVATGNFDTYTSVLLNGQTASEVQIRISWAGTPSGSEPMGIDNITVKGTVATSTPQLVISEIMYNPSSAEDAWEWIEIYNAGALTVDLTGFVIDDNNGVAHGSSNIAGGSIAPGAAAVLYNADDITATQFTDAWGDVILIPVTNWGAMALNNGGDAIGIWESFAEYSGDNQTQLNVIDNVNFDDSSPWPVDDGAGSIFLNNLSASNDDGSNWILSTDGTPTPLFQSYTSNALGGNSGSDIGSPGIMAGPILPLLLSEIVVTPTTGEFIEIHNPNTAALDLSDVYITDATFAGGGTYYYNIVTGANAGGGSFGDFLARFPDGSSIPAGGYQTIAISGSDAYFTTYGINPDYELFEDAAVPDGISDMREGLAGSINNQGGLTNGGEVAILFYWDGMTDLVTDLDYVVWGDKDEAVDKTGIAIDGPDAGATTSTYSIDTPIASQDVVALSAHSIGQSFQRDDIMEGVEITTGGNGVSGEDETSEDVSNTWCSSTVTPGATNSCGVTPIVLSKIHEVQGSGLVAALAGQNVKIEGIVTADYQNTDQLSGFFVQEEDVDVDGDNLTSEGIFVYCNTCPLDVSVGDLVEVTGLAEEFFGMTQIDVTEPSGLINVISPGNPLPSEAIINLPASASTKAEATFENVEGMVISIATNLIVSEYFALARYGQLILSADTRQHQFTDANEPDATAYSLFLDGLNSSRIILDDDTNIQNDATSVGPDEAYFWPRNGLSNSNFIRGGDQINNLKGIMHWSFAGQSGTDAWRIRPVLESYNYDFTEINPRTSTPDDVGGTFKVASFNVLNYFTTINSRGADSAIELDRQREKIAAAICSMNADVVGLIEIENNGMIALNDLLNGTNGINTICSATYAAIDAGIIGSDEITVAFIYNTTTVTPEGAFAILDGSVDPRFNDNKNRPALAQSFKEVATDAIITVVVNHLKSKGSACDDVGDPDLNDGSGNCNITRTEAAEAIVDWLATDPTNSSDPDFLIIGDLNSYRKEFPIDAILLGADDTLGTPDDFTDLLDNLLGTSAYSYVFDGQLGYLDYALANGSLASQITGTTAWHINSDEINIFDYNDEIQDAGESSFERESNVLPVYESNAFRASDHDPVIIGINLNSAPVIACLDSFSVNTNPGICGAIVNFADAIATDPDGDTVTVVQTSGLPSGSEFPVGISTIEFTATDATGNTAMCSFEITVVDNEAPVMVCENITIQLDENGNASIVASDIDGGSTDNCGIATIEASQTTFDCSNVGANNVTLTITDSNGNVNTCIAVVQVEDVTAPDVLCMNITVQLDVNGTVTVSGIQLDGGSTDACGIDTYTLDVDTFDCSHVGDNVVTLTVTDVNGNSAACTAVVTVEDTTSPELICMDVTIELDVNGTAVLIPNDVTAVSSDACGIDTLAIDITEVSCADIGSPIAVTVFASDVNGNISVCSAIVTVVDALAPIVTCPDTTTVNPGAGSLFYEVPDYFALGEASATDNCTDPLSIFTQDPAPGTLLPDGVHTITVTAEDAYGNIGTCTFELIVESILGMNGETLNNDITMYPNPANDNVIIRNSSGNLLDTADFFDINGRRILTVDLSNMQYEREIDLSKVASGIYMVQIHSENTLNIKRLIKE